MQSTLSNSATFGLEFDHETINTSYSVDLMNDIKASTEYDITVEVDIPCTEKRGEPGIGLWQFVTEDQDGRVTFLSPHTVCRYGSLYNTPPSCPWNACPETGDCSVCTGEWRA